MVPRTMVPVEGTRGPAGREMERVGWGTDLVVEGWEVRVPAREEWRCEDWMWVPGPGLLAEEGPNAWPGRARVDMIAVYPDRPVQNTCCSSGRDIIFLSSRTESLPLPCTRDSRGSTQTEHSGVKDAGFIDEDEKMQLPMDHTRTRNILWLLSGRVYSCHVVLV